MQIKIIFSSSTVHFMRIYFTHRLHLVNVVWTLVLPINSSKITQENDGLKFINAHFFLKSKLLFIDFNWYTQSCSLNYFKNPVLNLKNPRWAEQFLLIFVFLIKFTHFGEFPSLLRIGARSWYSKLCTLAMFGFYALGIL